ncbi:succinate dehydrogenase, hydrophobic membrane anchor protein [Advenella sp. S44]|nr:succinate dehydrogenase, hydrophobic membrane anchor protein [Advenella sp. S44]PJX22176.1 succinate dehydrogenase, hydrophobic membrane anchor protein [Advenella sp. S44]
MAKERVGTKRLVVGAGYGIKDFIVQRITAVILAVYSIIFLIAALFTPINYESWKGFFTFSCWGLPLGQIAATLAFFSLAWHGWIGVRDIWMDYVKPVGVRLTLQVLTILWLIAAVLYFAKIVWSL